MVAVLFFELADRIGTRTDVDNKVPAPLAGKVGWLALALQRAPTAKSGTLGCFVTRVQNSHVHRQPKALPERIGQDLIARVEARKTNTLLQPHDCRLRYTWKSGIRQQESGRDRKSTRLNTSH